MTPRSLKIWMPLFVGEILSETAHLSTTEHGAYMLLLKFYWCRQGLPTSDEQIARIARLPLADWLAMRTTIGNLFNADWSHNKLDELLAKQAILSAKRKLSGAKGGNRRALNADINKERARSTELPPTATQAIACDRRAQQIAKITNLSAEAFKSVNRHR